MDIDGTFARCKNEFCKTMANKFMILLLVMATASASAAVTVGGLRCEYLHDPLGVDVPKPRLGWVLQSDQRDISQMAYQVLVASSPELLAKGQGDLWDSGKVQSDESAHVEYGGSKLPSRQSCWWKVRVWDRTGAATAWSAPAHWEMGLLEPGDWRAAWISAPPIAPGGSSQGVLAITHATYEALDGAGAKDVTDVVIKMLKDNHLDVPVGNDVLGGDPIYGRVKRLRVDYTMDGKKQEAMANEGTTLSIPASALPYLRKDFTLGKPIAKARLYATALGLYELHLNGQRVGDHLFRSRLDRLQQARSLSSL
jgi:hypothetical protein